MDTNELPIIDKPDLTGLVIARGMSGEIISYTEDKVLKYAEAYGNEWREKTMLTDHLREKQVYERLGSHPRICRCYAAFDRGLVLEKAKECLRKRMWDLRAAGKTPAEADALKWSIQTAEGLAYVHQCQVYQGDIGCHNLLLDYNEDAKLCDFGGAAIDGDDGTAYYESGSSPYEEDLREAKVDFRSELFALGSTIYEIWTTYKPYEGKGRNAIEELYGNKQFPDVSRLLVGPVILRCWSESYENIESLIKDLEALQAKEAPILRRIYMACWEHAQLIGSIAAFAFILTSIRYRTPESAK